VVAVLCVSGPTARILDRLDEMALATRDAAREISERMRGTENPLEPR
jgi:DNA-binding IclR family transcriptional regulator